MSGGGEDVVIETRIVDPRAGGAPTRATAAAAGLDLRACLDAPTTISPGKTLVVGCGVAIFIRDPGYMGLLAPRSGLAVKHGIVLANSVGVIDADYQDEIRAALRHCGDAPYVLRPGERICQLIILPVARAVLRVVGEFSEETGRGLGGFGSTGRD